MIYTPSDDRIIYTGRWLVSKTAVTASPGAFFELLFGGESVAICFGTENGGRKPHIRITIDGKECYVGKISERIELCADGTSPHRLAVIFKSAYEREGRWSMPLTSGIELCSVEANELLPFSDNREICEVVGDSITEGCAIYEKAFGEVSELANDSCATWGYLTSERLGMRPYIVGYGAQGVTKGGLGGVPKAAQGYVAAFEGAPLKPSGARLVLVNHGANDCDASDEEYISEYVAFLQLVRERNPDATVFAITPFCGVKKDALDAAVNKFNAENGDSVHYIDAVGIVPEKPIHPDAEGHVRLSEHIYKKILESTVER